MPHPETTAQPEARDRVALALFRQTYAGCLDDDDLDYPDRVWASMGANRRERWYHLADLAIAAMAPG